MANNDIRSDENNIDIDKELRSIEELLHTMGAERDAEEFSDIVSSSTELPKSSGEMFGFISDEAQDILSSSPEKQAGGADSAADIDSIDRFSQAKSAECYPAEEMPRFFTESSEFEDDAPLDISEFYPPNTSDSADDAEQADTADSANDADRAEETQEDDIMIYDDNRSEKTADEYTSAEEEATRRFDAVDVVSEADAADDANNTADTAETAEETPAKAKKPNIFIRMLRNILPWKGDGKFEIGRKIVFLVALITLIVTVWNLVGYYVVEPIQMDSDSNDLRVQYKNTSTGYADYQLNPKFAELYSQNKDLVGWIQIKGTNVDYPVVRGRDNKQYERTTFYGKSMRSGSIFMDYLTSITFRKESRNMVIYGHNMRDNSRMFSQLINYRELDYYKKHPTLTFDTLYRDGQWKIFAVISTNAYPAQDNGQVFDYRRSIFADDEEFNAWVRESKIRSCITTGVDVLPTDTVLTLQTCCYEFTEGRFVIMARRVRDGEDAAVDVAQAAVNRNARYPQAWYDAKGQKNPFKNTPVQFNEPGIIVERTQAKATAANSKTAVKPNTVVKPTSAVKRTTAKPTQRVTISLAPRTRKATATRRPTATKPKTTARPTAAPEKTTTKPAPTESEETNQPQPTIDGGNE